MAAKEISVKKYVVRLSGEERERLEALIRKGKSPAQRCLRREYVEADASEAGEGWSDSRISGFGHSVSMVYGCAATGGGRLRGRIEPQATGDAGDCADFFDGEKEAN